jgi:hypothetical protein
MANTMSGQPLIMNTATTSWTNNGLPSNSTLRVFKIIWYDPVTAADTFSIVDQDGQVLLAGIANSTTIGSVVQFDFQAERLILSLQNGWYLKQISSGTLYIYFN